ncbi:MAG: HTH-type transcriptional regulator ChbR [Nitrosomonadaceae bacterium]|nr:HTH-type transcriptional regulator ChbR [Nitrosomonadaceae bacterium]
MLPRNISYSEVGRTAAPTVVDDFLSEMTISHASVIRAKVGCKPSVMGDNDLETLCFVAEGVIRSRHDELAREVGQGGLIHLRPGQHCTISSGSERSSVLIILHFQAKVLDQVNLSELIDFPAILNPGINSRVGHYFAEALNLALAAPMGRLQCLRSLVTLAVISLVRDHVPEAGEMLRREQAMQIRRLLPAVRILREDLGAHLSVENLALCCGLSVAQFRRLFCASFDMSPSQYIQRMRVREACRLLYYSDNTVSEICLRIGYEQPSHFHKTFKRIVGRTPRTYREEYMQQRTA